MDLDWKQGVIGLIVIVVFAVALFQTISAEECSTFECFQQHMIDCSFTQYVNEESEASWGYEIKGVMNEQCEIEVTLLNAKEGDLGLREFEGTSMSCFYDLGVLAYPEKDLDACHGELKENLQSVIIEKLYRHIVDNLGEIEEGLRGI